MKDIKSEFVEGCDIQLSDYHSLMSDIGSGYLQGDEKAIRKYDINQVLIDNGYKFQFECPLLTSEMNKLHGDDKSVDCSVCSKKVHIVNDIEDFNKKINDSKCVSFDPDQLFKSSLTSTSPTKRINKKPRKYRRMGGRVAYR